MAIPVVGIGASAGGLEAGKLLLGHLPANAGLAFVFVQHLDPKHRSNLPEILARNSAIPVRQAADGMAIERNHLYVIPPDADLEIADQVLRITPRDPAPAGPHLPIDRFLRSLAQECGSRAIGVILSGAGADGASGLEAVKASGGVTLAQDPATAKFASMPQAAIGRGCVDLVLSPEAIAAELASLGEHPYFTEDDESDGSLGQAGGQLGTILTHLRNATSIDLALYPGNILQRRILRRLALHNLQSLDEYQNQLENDPRELSALHQDLLIGFSRSFWDPASFASFKKLVCPRLLEDRPPQTPIRVWVPDCGTGEEAFSIAISLSEYLGETGASFPAQVFASDLSEQAIGRARSGRYQENIASGISAERLNRHFTKVEGHYQINKDLREMCVFSRHNLFIDPPFSKLDLVSCRNLQIYEAVERKNIILRLHYALKPDGLLMLVSSGTVAFPELFSLVDREHQIYARREAALKAHAAFGTLSVHTAAAEPSVRDGADLHQEVDRVLLSRYSPAGVLVDEELDVLEIRGKASSFLSLPAGKVTFNLLKLIPETSLFLEVEKLVHQVRRTGEPARQEHIPFDGNGHGGEATVEVLPLHGRRKNSLLILFEHLPPQSGAEAASTPPEPGDFRDRQIARLKQELSDAKQRFLEAIEEYQTSREESRNTTQEAQSTNEELQSLNEELETAKEELQTINEELTTLNQQLLLNNAAITAARDFAMSVIETVASPLLILDTDLRIKAANPSFYGAFQIPRREAEGQLLFSICNGCWDIPGLREMLERVLPDHKAVRGFEVERDFPMIGHRVLVLSARQLDDVQQILLGIDDVTDRQERADATLHESEERFRNMADAAPVMIWVSGPDKARTFFNKSWLDFTGRTMEQEVGDGWAEGVHPLDLDRCLDVSSWSFPTHRNFQREYRLRRADGEYRWLLDNGVPRFEPGGNFVGYIGSCIDITDLKRAQEEHLVKQKLESVGTLASGIAHDFNNLLGGVLAHAELALGALAEGFHPDEELQSIRAVAIRGSEIVRQLMIYAGQETELPELVDLSRIVQDMIELLRVAVSKHAAVETDFGSDLPPVRANPAQLRQVVMNLITNASEAIADKDGVIRVTTEQVTIGRESPVAPSQDLPEGHYLQLQVSDTGRGMTPEMQARIFDPFFTTRQAGHGLGLSVVQGIVRSLQGAIRLESAPGKGTTFRILLPCAAPADLPTLATPPGVEEVRDAPPEATILVVEDEGSLRQPVTMSLRREGFTVLDARDGSAALETIRIHKDQLDVLLLDISLPGIPSSKVFEEARRLRPDVAVIVTSAYSREKAAESLDATVEYFIRKPYRLNHLKDLIRQVLSADRHTP